MKMGKFDDIVNREYVKSTKRKHMTMVERAAQFGAFRAVVGHEDALHETARLTDKRIELDECAKVIIDEKLRYAVENPEKEVAITFFVPDEKKTGGAYLRKSGFISKFLEYERKIVFDDKTEIPIDEIVNIDIEELF